MDRKILFEALKSTWLITPEAADNYFLMLEKFFAGETNIFQEKEQEVMFMVNAEGKRITTSADAQNNGIAVINLDGPVMKNDYCGAPGTQSLMQALQQANDNPAVTGIVLQIDSPGGSVDGTQQFANAIKNSAKPVVAYINGMMASAAMWIGSAASQRIASSETDDIGSIGTMAKWRDYKDLHAAKGIKTHEVYATNSTDKNKIFREAEGNNPEGKSNYEPLQKTYLDPVNDIFTNTIQQNLPNADPTVLSGKLYPAQEAKKKGLIDKIGTFQDAVKSAHKLGKQKTQTQKNNSMKWSKVLSFLGITSAVNNADEVKVTDAQLDNMEAVINERDSLKTSNDSLKIEIEALKKTAGENKTAIEAKEEEIIKLNAEVAKLSKEDGAPFSSGPDPKKNTAAYKSKELKESMEMNFQQEILSRL